MSRRVPVRRRLAALPAALAVALAAGPAVAARPTPIELPATDGTAHLLVHYSPATATPSVVAAGAADFEEAYSRLVTGAGGVPNAGLRAPVADGILGGDARVDVYLVSPPAGGGQVYLDAPSTPPGHASGYVLMDPAMSRAAFRFRAAHELMHVLQGAYAVGVSLASESTASWAAEWALPDVDPGDNAFQVPHLPLDCGYGVWEGTDCAAGYRQWLFVQRQAEAYGPAFVTALLGRVEAICTTCVFTPVLDRQAWREAVTAASGGGSSLRRRYAEYMRALWSPSAWTTTAVATITGRIGPPAATDVEVSAAAPDTGARTTVNVDHLSTRYLRLRAAATDPAGPADRMRVTVSDTPGLLTATSLLVAAPGGGPRTEVALSETCPGGPCATVPFDRATVGDVVVPLVNDLDPTTTSTAASDDRVFTWRVEWLPGASAAPANDTRAGALPVALGVPAQTDTLYAGGAGAAEAASCPGAAGATRGVWFRFTAPNSGVYRFDATGGDFPAVLSLIRDGGVFAGCAWLTPSLGVQAVPGRVYDVYVGRAASATGTGRTARLVVTGPAAPPAAAPPPAPAPATGGSPTAPADTTAPAVTVGPAVLVAGRSGRVVVRVGCPAAEPGGCRGTLAVVTARRVPAALAGGRARVLTLGRASFAVAGGRTQRVTVKLTPLARRVVAGLRVVPVRVRVVARDASGNTFRRDVPARVRRA